MARLKLINQSDYIYKDRTYKLNANYSYKDNWLHNAIDTVESAIEEYNAVFAFRIDFAIQQKYQSTFKLTPKIIGKVLKLLKTKKYKIKHKDGTTTSTTFDFKYITKFEYGGDGKAYHAHTMFLFKLRDVNCLRIKKSQVYLAIEHLFQKYTDNKGYMKVVTHRESTPKQIDNDFVGLKNQNTKKHYYDILFSDSSENKKKLDPWITIRNDRTKRIGFYHHISYLCKYSMRKTPTVQIQATGERNEASTSQSK